MMLAIDFEQGLNNAWNEIATFVPKLLAFFAILIVGWIIAKLLAKVVNGLLERVGFDEAVERGGVKRALAESRLDASDILAMLVRYFVLLITLQAAFGVFGANPISDMLNTIVGYLPNVFVAIVIVIVASAIAAAVKEIIEAALGGLSYGRALAITASTAILVVGLFAAVNQLEIAPAIVTGLFYAMLAIVVGIAVVAVGGSGVTELRPYWKRTLERADEATAEISSASDGAADRIKQRAQHRADQAGIETNIAPTRNAQ